MCRTFANLMLVVLFASGCGRQPTNSYFINTVSEDNELSLLLNEHLQHLQRIELFAEEGDVSTLQRLSRQTRNVITAVSTRGAAHRETSRLFDVFQICFQDSQFFLDSIESEYTKPDIARLRELALAIEEKVGKPSPSQITAIVFDEIQKRLRELSERDISSDLKSKIQELQTSFGELIPIALTAGDVPATYRLSVPLCKRLSVELYPLLHQIDTTSKHYVLAIDLIGLIEGYRYRIRDLDGKQ